MKGILVTMAAATGCLCAAAAAQPCTTLKINEVRLDQFGPDNDEYVELRGSPGASLDGVWYVVIGDVTGAALGTQSGGVELAIDLTGHSLAANGLFLIAKDTFTLGTPHLTIPAASLPGGELFENSDNVTHLLVANFTGSLNQDLDTNDDGVLDITPWDAILCSVAIVEDPNPDGVSQEHYYSTNVIGPDGVFAPFQVWLCTDTDQWNIGDIDPGLNDTPGMPNPTCSGDSQIMISEIRVDQPGGDNDEYFELKGPPGASLNGLTYLVIGDGAAAAGSGVIEVVVSLSGHSINANGFFVVTESTFTLGGADLILPGANPLNFENADNFTHLLVSGFTGANGQDLDTNNDGVLDILPWGSVIDAIGIIDTTFTGTPPAGIEFVYGASLGFEDIGPDPLNADPGHVYRCTPAGTWVFGSFTLGVNDTPGAANDPCGTAPECGDPSAGSCFVAHATASCDDGRCCSAVCLIDPDCCSMAWDGACVALATDVCLTKGVAPPVIINEIRIDQPGLDNDEYFELKGPPGTSLDGVTYIVIGDGAPAAGSGVIEVVVPLHGHVIPADGHFLVTEATFTLGTPDLMLPGANPLNFENNDNVTHLLVFNFTGTNGQDLDVDDDGVLDITPWQTQMDLIALVLSDNPPTGTEFHYGPPSIGPEIDGKSFFVPGHVWRCDNTGEWNIGPFDTLIGVDTPGMANPVCDGKVTGACCLPSGDCEQLTAAACAAQRGAYAGDDTDCALVMCPQPCPGGDCQSDLNGSGSVNGLDLGILLFNWSIPAGSPGCNGALPCCADLNGNGVVDGLDLGILLGDWEGIVGGNPNCP
jgi:hypothetical protein